MGLLGAFTTRSDGQTITAAIWNNDFTQVRDWANTYAVLKDVSATITAVHTYSATPVFSTGFTSSAASSVAGNLTLSASAVRLILNETDETTDRKRWDLLVNGQTLTGRILNDADSSSATWLTVTRSGILTFSGITLHTATTISGTITATKLLASNGFESTSGATTVKGYPVDGVAGEIGTSTNHPLRLFANDITYLVVNNTGGITVTGPITGSSTLSISGALSGVTTLTATTGNITTVNATNGNITTVTATNLAGTLTTAAQANVTSVGTLTSLTVSGTATFNGNVAIGNAISDTVTINSDSITLTGTNPEIYCTNAASGNVFALSNNANTGNYLAIADPNGNSSTNAIMTIMGGFSKGVVRLGTQGLATNADFGFMTIPQMAGAPTGAPENYSVVWDSTNNRLMVRSGGAWKTIQAT